MQRYSHCVDRDVTANAETDAYCQNEEGGVAAGRAEERAEDGRDEDGAVVCICASWKVVSRLWLPDEISRAERLLTNDVNDGSPE